MITKDLVKKPHNHTQMLTLSNCWVDKSAMSVKTVSVERCAGTNTGMWKFSLVDEAIIVWTHGSSENFSVSLNFKLVWLVITAGFYTPILKNIIDLSSSVPFCPFFLQEWGSKLVTARSAPVSSFMLTAVTRSERCIKKQKIQPLKNIHSERLPSAGHLGQYQLTVTWPLPANYLLKYNKTLLRSLFISYCHLLFPFRGRHCKSSVSIYP